jgi:hypothetical protein
MDAARMLAVLDGKLATLHLRKPFPPDKGGLRGVCGGSACVNLDSHPTAANPSPALPLSGEGVWSRFVGRKILARIHRESLILVSVPGPTKHYNLPLLPPLSLSSNKENKHHKPISFLFPPNKEEPYSIVLPQSPLHLWLCPLVPGYTSCW